MTTAEIHKRRFLHIGLSLLVVGFLLISAGALTVWLPYRREQLAISEIKKVGSGVEWQIEMRRGGPAWLRQRIGDRYMKLFDRVDGVDLGFSDIGDAFLVHNGNEATEFIARSYTDF